MNEQSKRNSLINLLISNKKFLIRILTIIFIIIMILFIDFENFLKSIIDIGFTGTIVFIVVYTTTFLLRTYKLKLIFKGLGYNIPFSVLYFSNGACFAINDLTLGKVGDFVKIFILNDQTNLKLGNSTAGISIERVLDLILLFFISLLILLFLNLGDYTFHFIKTFSRRDKSHQRGLDYSLPVRL